MDRIYFTTPIYYVNAQPHLGHTYTTILADTLKRYHRSRGRDAYFLTGTDEHGDKIAQAAARDDVDPKAYADRISALFRSTWDTCGIAYNHFIRTTDDYHKATVSRILQQIYDAGDIYFGEYGGYYCYGCERFFTVRVSSKMKRRPQLEAAFEFLREGDSLVVWKFDRLARSTPEMLSLADRLARRGCELVSLTEQIDTSTPGGKAVFTVMAALAQLERDLNSERTKEAYRAKKAKGLP